MGIFNNLKKGVVLANIAEAHDAAFRCFDTYEKVLDITCLKTAAWFIKAGVMDLSAKYDFSVMQPITIQIMGVLTKSTLGNTMAHCARTLALYMSELNREEREYIQEIIDGGKAFREVEYEIPHDIRKKYERSW